MTKKIMTQYEKVRQSRACNMFDYYCVMRVAKKLEFEELAELTEKEYINIFSNFGKYMKKFNISQESKGAQ